MARPFEIHAHSIAKRPLSLEEMAEKYGASSTELSKIRTFVRSVADADLSEIVRVPRKRSMKIRSTKARTKHK